MESWRKVWREGIAPHLLTDGLKSLLVALRKDDPRIIQGANTLPYPEKSVPDWPVEACDAVCWTYWQGRPSVSLEEIELQFATICYTCNETLGYEAITQFLDAYDRWPRQEMRQNMIEEVELVLAHRAAPVEV